MSDMGIRKQPVFTGYGSTGDPAAGYLGGHFSPTSSESELRWMELGGFDDSFGPGNTLVLQGIELASPEQEEFLEKAGEVDRFFDYLKDRNVDDESVDYSTINHAENLWVSVQEEYETTLPVPLVSLGAGGAILFTWRRCPHYLEVEVFADRSEVFYEKDDEPGPPEFKEVARGLSDFDEAVPYFDSIANSQ